MQRPRVTRLATMVATIATGACECTTLKMASNIHIHTEPLGRTFGARLFGLGLAEALVRPESQPPELWRVLAAALTEHKLLLLRPGAGFGPAAEVQLNDRVLAALGVPRGLEPEPEPETETRARDREKHGKGGGLFAKYSKSGVQNLRGARVPGHPSLSLLGHGPVEDHFGLSGEMQQAPLGTGCHVNWHSDGAFHRRDQLPSRMLQFYCVRTPILHEAQSLIWARGDGDQVEYQPGATMFGSWSRALELAPIPLLKRCAQLAARYTGFAKTQAQGAGHPPYPNWAQTGCRPTAPPSVDPDADPVDGTPLDERLLHPLTLHHPASGQPQLFFRASRPPHLCTPQSRTQAWKLCFRALSSFLP